MNDTTDHGYLGHLVSAAFLAMIPIFAQVDLDSISGRIWLSAAGGLGAVVAILGDPPATKHDVAARLAGGVICCILFAPWVIQRLGVVDSTASTYATAGGIGLVSWYMIGSVGRGLRGLRDSGSLWRAIAIAIRRELPANGHNGSSDKLKTVKVESLTPPKGQP